MLVYNETQPFMGQIFFFVWFYFFNQCRLYSEIGFVLVFFLVFVAFLFAPLRPRGFSFVRDKKEELENLNRFLVSLFCFMAGFLSYGTWG